MTALESHDVGQVEPEDVYSGMTQVAIYCRISRDVEGLGLGVARQEADCRALAKKLGWTVAVVRQDNDLSAYALKRPRPAYQDLLEDVRTGRVQAIIAWASDRLHRSPRELEDFISLLETHGVAVQTVQAGPLDLSTPAGRLVARQLGAVARYESEHKAARIKRKHLELAEAGKPNGGRRPYGFERDGRHVPHEAAVIREIVERLLAGDSLRSVAADLNRRGIPAAGGGTWYTATIRRMLLNARLAGYREYLGKIMTKGTWDGIVSEDQWQALVHLITDPSRRTNPGGTARKHLITGIASCGVCGKSIISGAISYKLRYPVYRCYSRKHLCRRMEEVDDLIESLVIGRLAKPDAAALLAPAPHRTSALKLASEIEVVRGRLAREATAFAESEDMDRAEYEAIATTLRSRLARLEREQAQLATSSTRALIGLAGNGKAEKVWKTLDLSRKRAVIDALMTIRLFPAGRGAKSFDPQTVQVIWREAPEAELAVAT